MVNGLRGTAHFFAWQVQHLESLGAACGQRSPRDRALVCVPGATLTEPGRCLWSTVSAGPRTCLRGRCSTRCTGCCSFAWQVQHLESLGAACGQRSPRDRALFCVAGAALREPGRCLWSTVSAGPRTFLRGRCSTWCTGGCFCVAGAALREPGRCVWSTVAAGPRTFLRGRCSTRCTGCCFCMAGAALREPGRCLWSTVSAGPRTLLRGRCST